MKKEENKLSQIFPDVLDNRIRIEQPLLWGDMDSAKHVNNLIYLKWVETSRILFFDQMMDISFEGSAGPILGWQDCKYIFPMTFPDTAMITCHVSEIKEDRFMLLSKVYSIQHQRLSAISNQSIVPYNYKTLKKIPMPEEWISKLESWSVL